ANGSSGGVRGLFITGTSIGLLPVSRIDDLIFHSADDPVIKAVRAEYEAITREYILTHRPRKRRSNIIQS
ncbi:MAG: hypothetical protein LBU58_11615, partial [Clostridiales bacterium]|nr:hypothetical protein [Clostridiales bacterium]